MECLLTIWQGSTFLFINPSVRNDSDHANKFVLLTLSLFRGHSWRVRLAKQETLTPPGHLVSPLVFRGPWMSTVVLYCWCHSDSASVLLYFTFIMFIIAVLCNAMVTFQTIHVTTYYNVHFFLKCIPFLVHWAWHGCTYVYTVVKHVQRKC